MTGRNQGGGEHPAALRRRWIVVAVVLIAVLGGLALTWRVWLPSRSAADGQDLSRGKPVPAVARRETKPTLDPALFVGKARLAHQIAREIPDVLDQLYCYCECDKHVGHKSLLSCYTDGHAAT